MADEQEEVSEEQPEEAEEQPSEEAEPAAPAPPPRRRGGASSTARAYIKSSFNNTLISIADLEGNVLCWASGGSIGFQGTKKGTPFAAQLDGENLGRRAVEMGIRKVDVFVKGPGSGRETAIRALQAAGVDVGDIKDVTPIPHNGCRPKKRRRM